MMDSKGKITALGLQYIGANSTEISGAASMGTTLRAPGLLTCLLFTFLTMFV